MDVLRAEAVRLAENTRKAREEADRDRNNAGELAEGGKPKRWELGILRWLPFLAIAHAYLAVRLDGYYFRDPNMLLEFVNPLSAVVLMLLSLRVRIWQGVMLGLLSPAMLALDFSPLPEHLFVAALQSIVPLTIVMCGWTLWSLRRRGKGRTALTAGRLLLALAAPPLLHLALSLVQQEPNSKGQAQPADSTPMAVPAVMDTTK